MAIRRLYLFLVLTAFVLTSALSHMHLTPQHGSAGAEIQMMHHAMTGNHVHGHGSDDGTASPSNDTPHCCSMGGCGFNCLPSPRLVQSDAKIVLLPMKTISPPSIETSPDAPPPRSVG